MRAAGEAHRAVVMSVSVGVRVEQLGGKHTAPLTGRAQQQTIKKGKSRKEKPSTVIAPKAKKGVVDGRLEKKHTKKVISTKNKKVENRKINLKYAKKKRFISEICSHGEVILC
ncbi:hypothetical protein TCDM_12804 [Trypanosoma cruzi Dm28c]|uniref:Uncharacterized protein n=1 Tax=Trypanosoma cruzi Dm28c TaxID=1416333 RepID=V5CK13_TRYCR|nr:hypothetical protein TCDM_12804 [Trypanosoma cruzi Dm28c]